MIVRRNTVMRALTFELHPHAVDIRRFADYGLSAITIAMQKNYNCAHKRYNRGFMRIARNAHVEPYFNSNNNIILQYIIIILSQLSHTS